MCFSCRFMLFDVFCLFLWLLFYFCMLFMFSNFVYLFIILPHRRVRKRDPRFSKNNRFCFSQLQALGHRNWHLFVDIRPNAFPDLPSHFIILKSMRKPQHMREYYVHQIQTHPTITIRRPNIAPPKVRSSFLNFWHVWTRFLASRRFQLGKYSVFHG